MRPARRCTNPVRVSGGSASARSPLLRSRVPGMKLFGRNLMPLAMDSTSSLNLPRVRMGLLAKLNLLTIALIFVTAIATTGFYLWQQWRDENGELYRRGSATLAMLSELAEYGLYTNNRNHVDAMLDSL